MSRRTPRRRPIHRPSTYRHSVWGLALGCLAFAALEPRIARAAPADPVEAAERAYKEVDFSTQLAEATRALEEGGHDPATLANIYRLLGIAHAALGAHEAAQQDFIRLLAVDPDVALEQVLSPRLRTPYLEARGFWDVSRSRLELGLGIDAASGDLRIALSDPLEMGRRVRVASVGDEPRTVADLAAAPELVVDAARFAPHAGRPLQVELLDAHANVVVVRVLTPPRPPAPARATTPAPATEARAAEPSPPTLALALGGGALVALGVGVTAHVIRENQATEWNGAGCERLGRGSRSDQCGDVDDQRRSAQTVAVVGYAAGAALLAASVVSYLATSDGEQEPDPAGSLAIGLSPRGWGLSCNASW
ncbi:MAG TPA: hypothetical protein VMG12_40515 [Polyangiaceae bacterium]|nr:hypothetical protein [Polyangiaceae bacterium]